MLFEKRKKLEGGLRKTEILKRGVGEKLPALDEEGRGACCQRYFLRKSAESGARGPRVVSKDAG